MKRLKKRENNVSIRKATWYAVIINGLQILLILVVLFAVLIYELFGPMMTKSALTAAGEITEKSKEVIERRARKLAVAEPRELLLHIKHFIEKGR